MKKIKSFASLVVLMGVIIMGVSNARAGMLMSDFTGGASNDPCVAEPTEKVDNGVVVWGLTEIFGSDIMDAILGKSEDKVDCGVVVHG